MRDENYYQRLNEIRHKYGYLRECNPAQQLNRPTPPTAQPKSFTPSHYSKSPVPEIAKPIAATHRPHPPTKSVYKAPVQPIQKENYLQERSSLPFDTHRHPEVQRERREWGKQEEEGVKSQLNSILQKAIISQLSSRTRNQEKEMSPIRILKDDVTSHISEFRVTPLPIDSKKQLPPQTPPASRKHMPDTFKREHDVRPSSYVTPIYQETPLEVSKALPQAKGIKTPGRVRDLPTGHQISRKIRNQQEKSPEMEEKYNFSLQNIAKIQSKIQSMLGKPKK